MRHPERKNVSILEPVHERLDKFRGRAFRRDARSRIIRVDRRTALVELFSNLCNKVGEKKRTSVSSSDGGLTLALVNFSSAEAMAASKANLLISFWVASS